jgi:hypothetical protein
MSKKRFIQDYIIRLHPPIDAVQGCIYEAENVWEIIQKAGYGTEQSTPRQNKDYYAELNSFQREWFDKFWQAFSYKKGRDGAAMRWGQLGNLSIDDYKKIIIAAERESKIIIPSGTVRKMAEGWLFERRYADQGLTQQHINNGTLTKKVTLHNELEQLKLLYGASKNQSLLEQINKIKSQLTEV